MLPAPSLCFLLSLSSNQFIYFPNLDQQQSCHRGGGATHHCGDDSLPVWPAGGLHRLLQLQPALQDWPAYSADVGQCKLERSDCFSIYRSVPFNFQLWWAVFFFADPETSVQQCAVAPSLPCCRGAKHSAVRSELGPPRLSHHFLPSGS